MWERLQQKVRELKARDKALVESYLIIEALKTYGHSWISGSNEAMDYLHGLGMDDETIGKMAMRVKKDPVEARESLQKNLYNSLK